MIKKFKSFILSGMLLLAVAAPAALPSTAAFALDCTGVPNKVAGGADQAATGGQGQIACTTPGDTAAGDALNKLAQKVVNIFTIIVGAASVIMIVYGGFRYITSGGSSERVGAAKNTLIYAIIGLIIVGLAQILVHFVLSQAANSNFG
jgi:predicted permease